MVPTQCDKKCSEIEKNKCRKKVLKNNFCAAYNNMLSSVKSLSGVYRENIRMRLDHPPPATQAGIPPVPPGSVFSPLGLY